jgi:DNA processing protein
MNIITIKKEDDLFPMALKAIGDDCPNVIYAMGNIELLKANDMVAIISSRKATRQGNGAAYSLGVKLAKEGKIIVSGLTLGCDTSVHRGCLSVDGKTIAIVATGLNLVHPRENESLQAEILQKGGLIISEQPIGQKRILLDLLLEIDSKQLFLK